MRFAIDGRGGVRIFDQTNRRQRSHPRYSRSAERQRLFQPGNCQAIARSMPRSVHHRAGKGVASLHFAFFSPAIAKRLRDQCREAFTTGQAPRKTGELTSREAEVLQLIAEGFSNKQIASEINISIKTVEKHRQQVMNKLNIHDVAGLTRYAISKGMVERIAPAGV